MFLTLEQVRFLCNPAFTVAVRFKGCLAMGRQKKRDLCDTAWPTDTDSLCP